MEDFEKRPDDVRAPESGPADNAPPEAGPNPNERPMPSGPGGISAVVVNGRIALQGDERRDAGRHAGTPLRPTRR